MVWYLLHFDTEVRFRLLASGHVADGADPVPDSRMILRLHEPVFLFF